ncbi:MAG TPA: Ig-like domain-containing protein [Gemmatimonadales bacterium]|nr:Ig-like domain-containing protein [Gemmatimonadales bacterium]
MRTIRTAFPAALACALIACSSPTDEPGDGSPASTVAEVLLSPTTIALAAGDTGRLAAVVHDAAAHPIPNPSVTWSTSDTAIVTVSSSGLLSARHAGTATVRASAGGGAGTATVTVTAASPQPPIAAGATSCASRKPGWIWCDDFEQNRLASYFEYAARDGGFVRQNGTGRNGSWGMRARFSAGQQEAGNLKLAFGRTPSSTFQPVDGGTKDYREIYWRVYVRTQPGYVGGNGNSKFTRATIFAGSNWQQAAFGHLWTTGDNLRLGLDPASGTDAAGNLRTTTYNDFPRMRWLGAVSGTTPVFDGAHAGKWHCVEVHMRLNDSGQSNGLFEFWVDGVLQAQRTGLNWVGAYKPYGINAVLLENYWNKGSPKAQERYFDDFVVSTQRVGC